MAVNLMAVSKSPRLLAFFKGFLATLEGLENYLFWEELEEVRKRFELDGDDDELRANSWILYQEYLQPGARFEIVVQENLRQVIFDRINTNQVTLDIFEEVEIEVVMCLQNECIPKFLTSDWYQRYEDHSYVEPETVEPLSLVNLRGKMKSCVDVTNALQEQSLLFDRLARVEKDYLERVRIFVHYFKTGLDSVLKNEDSDLLFGNVEQIYQVHQYISQVMVPDYPIPKLFQKIIYERHFLDIYTRYLTNLPFVRLLWEVLLKDSKFSKTVHSLEKASKSRSKKYFEQLLFEVPLDYLNSLHSLLSFTSSSSDIPLSSSNEVQIKIQGLINDLLLLAKKQQPTISQKRLFELREQLVGYPGNLTKPDRQYVMEGPLLLHPCPISPCQASSPPPPSSSSSPGPKGSRPKKKRPLSSLTFSSHISPSSPPSSPTSPSLDGPPIKFTHSSSPRSSSPSPPPPPKEMYFFLFNDKLVSATLTQKTSRHPFSHTSISHLSAHFSSSSSSSSGIYQFVDFYPLLAASVGERGGKIMVDGGAEELCLEPKQEDLKKWCDGIQKVVDEWQQQRQQQRKTKEQHLLDIVQKMKLSVQCQDRGVFRKVKNCFTGTDGVYFLISKIPGCNTKEEAEALGTQLLQAGYITSCSNLNIFREKNSFYRFP